MLVIFVGPPGTGKGTQSKRLIRYLNAVHLSTGDMLRAEIEKGSDLGEKARIFMDQGQLVPCEIMVNMITTRLQELPAEANFLLDGFPRTIHQAEELNTMLGEMDRSIAHRGPGRGVVQSRVKRQKFPQIVPTWGRGAGLLPLQPERGRRTAQSGFCL